MKKRRVLVADDHPLAREGLVTIINRQPDLEVCAQAGSPSLVISCIERERPEAVVLDLFLGREDGLPLIENLCAHHPGLRILVISMQDEQIYGGRCRRAGAHGFVSKLRPTARIVTTLREILGGSLSFESGAEMPVEDLRAEQEVKHPSRLESMGLTPREAEVAHWIAEGKTSMDIAGIFNCSPHTVDKHAERILEKLGVETRTAAAAEVRRRDLR